MKMSVEDLLLIPIRHLTFDDVRVLCTDDMKEIRIKLIDELSELERVINIIKSKSGDWHKHATVKSNYKKVIGFINGLIKGRNKDKQHSFDALRLKLRNKNIKINELQNKMCKMKSEIKELKAQADKGV